jgi:UPF0288 family protein (methanogenesis marker protein 3)
MFLNTIQIGILSPQDQFFMVYYAHWPGVTAQYTCIPEIYIIPASLDLEPHTQPSEFNQVGEIFSTSLAHTKTISWVYILEKNRFENIFEDDYHGKNVKNVDKL